MCIRDRKKALRREMGMIFQSAALFDSMTVLDNVMFPLNMFSSDTLRARTRRAMFCLERVNLVEAKDKFPGEIRDVYKRQTIADVAVHPRYKEADLICRASAETASVLVSFRVCHIYFFV